MRNRLNVDHVQLTNGALNAGRVICTWAGRLDAAVVCIKFAEAFGVQGQLGKPAKQKFATYCDANNLLDSDLWTNHDRRAELRDVLCGIPAALRLDLDAGSRVLFERAFARNFPNRVDYLGFEPRSPMSMPPEAPVAAPVAPMPSFCCAFLRRKSARVALDPSSEPIV